MIDYRYNKEKHVIVAFFCDDVSKKFEGKKYWYKNICSSLWKIFDDRYIQYCDFLSIVKKDVNAIQIVAKVKVTKDCDMELAKEIAKNRLILKWTRLEYKILEEVLSNIATQYDVVIKKLKKISEKIDRLSVCHKAEN